MHTNASRFLLWSVVCTILAGNQPAPAAADETEPAAQTVDRSLFPDGYGTLASERLMYPVDMADWPVRIGQQSQLFVDNYLIADESRVTRQLHQPVRHPANPVLRLREKPWEHSIGHSVFVLPSDTGDGYRMWYNVRNFVSGEDGISYRAPTCYAESPDGIHWHKPELGIFRFGDNRRNNITLLQGTIDGLFHEPDDPDPARRFKAIVWHDPKDQKQYAPREGFYLYWSADGIHWEGDNHRWIMPHGQSQQFPEDLADGVGDTTQFRRDTRLNRYVANVKILFRNPTLRTAGISESDDLIHWSRPRMIMHRDSLDDPDAQIYEHITFEYESLWIGLVRVMHEQRAGWKQVDVELSCSRDGRHWTRVCRGQQFLPPGDENAWDADYLIPGRPGAPLLFDDQLQFYYWGARRTDKRDASSRRYDMHIGAASLRRDGFVSLDCGAAAGHVTTRPLTFDGTRLFVNADISEDGYVKAEWQDAAGQPLEGYEIRNCRPVRGDVISEQVQWQNTDHVPASSDTPLRLKFELQNARLYSFRIE